MIEPVLLSSFVIVSVAVIAMPGPNVLLIVATSLAQGRLAGLKVVAGAALAMAIQLAVAARGTALLAETLADAFVALKWIGAGYLVWLGAGRLRRAFGERTATGPAVLSGSGNFGRGFVVGITNPKTILFFGAFLPQFTTAALPIGPQIAALSGVFLLLAVLLDSLYAVAAGAAGRAVSDVRWQRRVDGGAGVLLVGSGVGLALTSRP